MLPRPPFPDMSARGPLVQGRVGRSQDSLRHVQLQKQLQHVHTKTTGTWHTVGMREVVFAAQ